jgi:DAK2 domain fusion protein YloV
VPEKKTLAVIKAKDLSNAFIFATQWLGVFIDEVNALNVYPVPDGDTGTNMHLTLQSVRRQLGESRAASLDEVAHALSYGSLLGARGNSGVILSQVLKGIADSIKGLSGLRGQDVADALVSGAASAYAAVMKPVEGTILTVVRESAEAANNASRAQGAVSQPVAILQVALDAGRETLARTPDMLPILKQAGVVDAGGLGYLRLLEGLIAYFEARDLPPPPKVERRAQQQFEEEEFGFCTEFLLADVTVPTVEIQQLVAPYGDSLLVVGAEGFVKGHIHTQEPEKLLAEVGRFGRMIRSKVEDMSEQHSEILADVNLAEAEPPLVAAVAVASGYGLTHALRSLGVRVVGGGQTDNPSVQDIADAVRSVGAESVIVMPNNKNIVMAADRVAELVPGKVVKVLPTRTLGQGLAAAVVFNEGMELGAAFSEMERAAMAAVTLEVTTASRDVELDGVAVREGQAIGLADGVLVVARDDVDECLLALLDGRADSHDVATLFHNADVSTARAESVIGSIAERFPELEVELHSGAPDLYAYLAVLE